VSKVDDALKVLRAGIGEIEGEPSFEIAVLGAGA